MKSLSEHHIAEVLHLDDIPRGEKFAQQAAKCILENPDMYSIYQKIYAFKEEEVERNLYNCILRKPSHFFIDTKEQNGCCRVGQTKMFHSNFPIFQQHAHELRQFWAEDAEKIFNANPHIDFYLHMMSTIPSAAEVHKGLTGSYSHLDEIWIWIPQIQTAEEHLIYFLNAFHATPAMNTCTEVELLGPNTQEKEALFAQNFHSIPCKVAKTHRKGASLVVLYFKAGSLNSRKAMISPYLPKIL